MTPTWTVTVLLLYRDADGVYVKFFLFLDLLIIHCRLLFLVSVPAAH